MSIEREELAEDSFFSEVKELVRALALKHQMILPCNDLEIQIWKVPFNPEDYDPAQHGKFSFETTIEELPLSQHLRRILKNETNLQTLGDLKKCVWFMDGSSWSNLTLTRFPKLLYIGQPPYTIKVKSRNLRCPYRWGLAKATNLKGFLDSQDIILKELETVEEVEVCAREHGVSACL